MATGMKDPGKVNFVANTALVFYGIEDSNVLPDDNVCAQIHDDSAPRYFVSRHAIRNGILCEGAPLTKRTLLRLCKTVIPSLSKELSFIPEHVLNYNPIPTSLIWWKPASVKHLFFAKKTGIRSGLAPLPPLLFRFNGTGLGVFALKENRRPTLDSDLWGTIFHNFSCAGNVKYPEHPTLAQTDHLEDLFFRSAFTGHNPPQLNGTTADALWKSLVKSGKTEFPMDCLVKIGTVGDLFKRGADDYSD